MTHLGLFEGIGGFSLAARWAGWETVAWCEWNEFCKKVLRQHFKEAKEHGDIDQTDFKIYANRIDIITGGFPCQPYSTAGLRKGKEDDRHKWPQMLRAIREVQPRWVVGENVYGLINWNGGLVFDEVQADLENEGYEVQPYILPACSKNAPHLRDRIWFVAHSNKCNDSRTTGENESEGKKERLQERHKMEQLIKPGTLRQVFTNTNLSGLQVRLQKGFSGISKENETRKGGECSRIFTENYWGQFPTTPPICGGNDGVSDRVDRIKALGNAIVPQVAYEIFKAINEYERLTTLTN